MSRNQQLPRALFLGGPHLILSNLYGLLNSPQKIGFTLSEIWNTILAPISQLTSCVGSEHLAGLRSVINACAILLGSRKSSSLILVNHSRRARE